MERLIHVTDGAPSDPISVFAPGTWMARTSPSIWYTAAEIETNTDGALLSAATAERLVVRRFATDVQPGPGR
jgi:hypothetical protein